MPVVPRSCTGTSNPGFDPMDASGLAPSLCPLAAPLLVCELAALGHVDPQVRRRVAKVEASSVPRLANIFTGCLRGVSGLGTPIQHDVAHA